MSIILSVDNLRVEFQVGSWWQKQSILAVAGVSFNVNQGETLALVGESGSGKSTLARAINCLQPISGGTITFEGARIDQFGSSQMKPVRQRMSMMFQDPIGSLSPRMRVGDLITEPLRIHGGTRHVADAERLLATVGLSAEFADRYAHQLSGGQARRVGVARALALNPKLIIADEPTAGLDVSVQGEVLNLLIELRERLNLAMIFITHNLHVVRQIADRMAVMYLGRFVESGETSRIFKSPQHPYTRALLSANPQPEPGQAKQRITLSAEVPSLLSRPSGCEFHPRCPWVQPQCKSTIPPSLISDERRVVCHSPLNDNGNPKPDTTT